MRRFVPIAAVGMLLAPAAFWTLNLDTRPRIDPRVPSSRSAPERPDQPRPPKDLQASPPEAVQWRSARCPLTVEVVAKRTDQRVLLFDPTETDVVSVAADVGSYHLEFAVPVAQGAALVTLYGFQQASVVWWTGEDGTVKCAFTQDPEPAPLVTARISVDLPDNAAARDVWVWAGPHGVAGKWREESVDVQLEPGPQDFIVCRRNRALHTCDEAYRLVVSAGPPVEIQLSAPEHAPAGVDVTLSSTVGGFLATVGEGSHAERAGLTTGDLVVGIDGLVTADLDDRQLTELMVGRAGSTVVLDVVRNDGDPMEIVVARTGLDRPAQLP